MPSVEELEAALAAARAEQRAVVKISNSVPQQEQLADPYAPTAWGATEFDFITPTGQRCRLRNVPIEELAKIGVLDRITRLPGIAETLVGKSEGAPPRPEMPEPEVIASLTEVLNELIPIVVVAPTIYPLPGEEGKVTGRIYVDSIDFRDRVAILHRVVGDLSKLDDFRSKS